MENYTHLPPPSSESTTNFQIEVVFIKISKKTLQINNHKKHHNTMHIDLTHCQGLKYANNTNLQKNTQNSLVQHIQKLDDHATIKKIVIQ